MIYEKDRPTFIIESIDTDKIISEIYKRRSEYCF